MLPAGYQERFDQSGRLYYVDHNTRSTAWVRPSRHHATAQRTSSQMRRDAAQVFRSRHHISHEDTIAVNDDGDATGNASPRSRHSVVAAVSCTDVCHIFVSITRTEARLQIPLQSHDDRYANFTTQVLLLLAMLEQHSSPRCVIWPSLLPMNFSC